MGFGNAFNLEEQSQLSVTADAEKIVTGSQLWKIVSERGKSSGGLIFVIFCRKEGWGPISNIPEHLMETGSIKQIRTVWSGYTEPFCSELRC